MPWLFLLALVAGCATLQRPADGKGTEPVRASALLDPARGGLVVEVDRLEGVEPRPAALERFARRLAFYVDQPEGIRIAASGAVPPGEWTGTAPGLRDLVRRNRDAGLAAGLYVLYARSQDRYRGYCYRAGDLAADIPVPVVVVFADRLKPILWLSGTMQEVAVLLHETGHALGLVTAARHRSRGHCTNGWCAMYAGVDLRSVLAFGLPALFAGRLPTHFCRDCRADLWPDGAAPGLRDVPGMPTADRPGADPDFPESAR